MKLYFLLLALLIISCKTTYDKESYSNIEREKITYVLPSESTLEVDNICDSIESPLKLTKTVNTGSSKVSLSIKDNKLRVEVKSDTVYKEKIVYKDKEVIKEKKVTKFKWAKITWFFFGLIILGAFFPIIFQVINGLIRSLFLLIFKIPI